MMYRILSSQIVSPFSLLVCLHRLISGRMSVGSNKSASTPANEPSVIAQVKNFFAESVNTVESQTHAKVAGAVVPRTSLPSNETAGALPGEHTTGVGALPGPASEAGVAVLPEEKSECCDGFKP